MQKNYHELKVVETLKTRLSGGVAFAEDSVNRKKYLLKVIIST